MTEIQFDILGQKFNRLTAIEYKGRGLWLFECECGNRKVMGGSAVRLGRCKSCGCYQREKYQIGMAYGTGKHKMFGTPTYTSWAAMKGRCLNPNSPDYKDYGERGIAVCDRWNGKHGFEHFIEDMGVKPKGRSLDRIDVNGDYCPENCRWATNEEQANNKRGILLYSYNGKKQSLIQWCRELGVSYGMAKRRRQRHPDWGLIQLIAPPLRNYLPK